MDREQLKRFALLLEGEIITHQHESKDVKALGEYEPLVSAIRNAKEEKINHPIELPAMSYWYFETNIQDFKNLTDALTTFSQLLKGRDLSPDV